MELRFETRATEAAVRKVARSLTKKYPRSEEQALVTFNSQPIGPPRVSGSFSGFKLSKADQGEIAVITRDSFSRSMLPPYAGFDTFRASILEDWQTCQSAYSDRLITRLGMRFVNRIDIPSADRIDLADYIRIVTIVPDLIQEPLIEQICRVVFPISAGRMICFINVATLPSPMIQHQSILLDIEVAREATLPQVTTELFEMIDEFRESKNHVFEACITDAVRALIGAK